MYCDHGNPQLKRHKILTSRISAAIRETLIRLHDVARLADAAQGQLAPGLGRTIIAEVDQRVGDVDDAIAAEIADAELTPVGITDNAIQ